MTIHEQKLRRRLLALSVCLLLLLSACASGEKTPDARSGGSALTWTRWNGFDDFLELAGQAYPEIEWEYTAYAGANRTGYSWAQMRADDIPDIFISSQIIDEDLAKERLVDLSKYDFIDGLSTALLDQVAIDGGIYALPVNNVMYGIYYNKTLMEEHGWELPTDLAELEALCGQIREAGMEPGYIGMQLTGVPFAAVFNLAKTGWFSTLSGVNWERDFLAGNATAAGYWEGTMDYVQKYIDIGMFNADPEDHSDGNVLKNFVGTREAVFCTSMQALGSTQLENGDEIGIMPFISEDGGKNLYMYSPSCYIGISRRLTEPGNEEKLDKLDLGNELLNETLREYLARFYQLSEKVDIYNLRIEELSRMPEYEQKVRRLCCMNGIATHTAMCAIVEIGDFKRFPNAEKFSAFLGLVPGERSSGDKEYRTRITKHGNAHLRRLLVEATQSYSRGAVGKKSDRLKKRQAGQPAEAVAYADKAAERLRRKFRKVASHANYNIAKTAVARELACFIWGMMTENYA